MKLSDRLLMAGKIERLETELRSARKRERRAYLIIREWRCHNSGGRHPCFQSGDGDSKMAKCTMSKCPLLAGTKARKG